MTCLVNVIQMMISTLTLCHTTRKYNTITDGSKSQKYCPGALFNIINTTNKISEEDKILNRKQHQMYKLTSNKLKMKIRLSSK